MKTVTGFSGAALIFWGWQAGLLPVAMVMAIVIEGAPLVSTRLSLDTKNFRTVWSLSALSIIFVVAILFASNFVGSVVFTVALWLPFIFFPVVVAQVYSDKENIGLTVFSSLYRQSRKKGNSQKETGVNVVWPYALICIISASAANQTALWYYIGMASLAIWALWHIRPKRFSTAKWLVTISFVVIAGYIAGVGLHRLQTIVENTVLEWYSGILRASPDPFRTFTSIGEVGELKRSDRILFRVTNEAGESGSLLLPRGSFNTYRMSSWFANNAPIENEVQSRNGLDWVFSVKGRIKKIISISAYIPDGFGLLTVPDSVQKIERLPAKKMSRNRMGAIKVEGVPRYINYRVIIGEGSNLYGPPDERDLAVPENLKPVMAGLANELQLAELSESQVVDKVYNFFDENFYYTLNLKSGFFGTPLSDFLNNTRAGHCEYFATSTTLLLRQANIPARYVFGYSVHEYSSMEGAYIVRARDAHAWTVAYIEGEWKIVDTTPGVWLESDKSNASFFEPIYDLWSYIVFRFSTWRWSKPESGNFALIVLALAPLLVYAIYRFRSVIKGAYGVKNKKNRRDNIEEFTGSDSPFYLVEKRMSDLGFKRHSHETFFAWQERVNKNDNIHHTFEEVRPMISLHYRYRFDPVGISSEEKKKLEDDVLAWLDRHKAEK